MQVLESIVSSLGYEEIFLQMFYRALVINMNSVHLQKL